jgi:hypothetical protein
MPVQARSLRYSFHRKSGRAKFVALKGVRVPSYKFQLDLPKL